ncbi:MULTISPECIES: sugar phosphate nucleotidyltransferase [Paenibacillus]|uniref:sugar phosphate nucleotidyltransferase n=1 Tax=Paenibacillus TaxID=44249 RepID=UPI0022B8A788|nr:sugar phosphate nucleotidyltransferase [Paenibacillus caseinilyticus]MCZ8520406.1 sugar phosphate nucleotidyltransferase [Paenibacillus caseinilyticus]
MHTILLSGGSGKRLWPLSNGVRTKVFLPLLQGPDGGRESMLQRICRQLDGAGLLQSALLVSHHSQTEVTLSQIGSRIPVLSESHRRGTFCAVALAAVHLYASGQAQADDPVCFLPADLFAEAGFFDTIRRLPDILARSGADLALIGTQPTQPSAQFGYIVPKKGESGEYYPIARFTEKPGEAEAKRLIRRRALWNCGVYAFKLGFLLSELKKRGLPWTVEELGRLVEGLHELSFDREVAEQTPHAVVVPYDLPWTDLGTWEALASQFGSPVLGQGSVSGLAQGTQLVNELPIPIHVIGASNLIVAASQDGILVADKSQSHLVKEAIEKEEAVRSVRYVEKRWGSKTVIDHTASAQRGETCTTRIRLAAGKHTSYHLHTVLSETIIVLDGQGEVRREGVLHTVKAGDRIEFPPGCAHAVKALSDLLFLQIHFGEPSSGTDHLRIRMEWDPPVLPESPDPEDPEDPADASPLP